jgi:hypothetical protein
MRTLALVSLVVMLACKSSEFERISGSGPPVDFVVNVTESQIGGAQCRSSGQCVGHFVGYVDKRSDSDYVPASNTPVYTTLQSDQQSSLVADTTVTSDANGDFALDWTFALPPGNLTFTFCGGASPRSPDTGCARIRFEQ